MATALNIIPDQAHGRPPLASMALSPRPWTISEARSLIVGDPRAAIAEARIAIEQHLAPVPRDTLMRAEWKSAMDERLRRLAVKIAPAMSVEQGKPWRDVIVEALSDLPAMVALTAVKRAIHRPMHFLNEVEAVVRELAATVMLERKVARLRLDELLAGISRADQKALPPQQEGAPLSAHEIRKMSPAIRSIGLTAGALTQEQIDEADGLPDNLSEGAS